MALSILLMLSSNRIQAQSMGISSTLITPNPSSILELRTTSKGMLIPRMTETERDGISSPAIGLMIFNTSNKQFNFYNESNWVALMSGNTAFLSVDAGTTVSTSSTSDSVVEGMSKTVSEAGTYLILFNSQVTIPQSFSNTGFSTATAKTDLNMIYSDIANIPVTNTTHAAAFGNGEVLTTGVYDISGAGSIAGGLTLDGKGDSNAIFVVRTSGAFTTGADVTVILTNGARAENIFWVAEGAISLGAGTSIDGTLLSHGGAVSAGTNSIITGRLLSTSGAISFGEGAISAPRNTSFIDFRSLSDFVIFTSLGAISNEGASIYNGNIGTNGGAVTGFTKATVNGKIFKEGDSTFISPINHMATFSLYKNGVLIPNSSRTRTHLNNPSDISLQGFVSVEVGDTIDVRWKIDAQDSENKEVRVANRILTLTKEGN